VILGLPYDEIWAVDFEFLAEPGDRPIPVCMVAREIGSGRLIRMWQDELPAQPPFRTDDKVLFLAYLASAELGCFLELGWPMPARLLDLFVEFRAETNGIPLPDGRSLLGALSYHRIPSITSEEKQSSRALVMRGGPWTPAERRHILDYCQTDVDPMGALLERMLPRILATPQGFGQALLRGRYMAAVAHMERTGVPIDVGLMDQIRTSWASIKLDLISAVDKDYGVFDGATFKAGLFAAWLAREGIDWPRTPTGRLVLDQDMFKDMSKTHPQLAPLKELRHALGELRVEKLAVGQDGRNRTLLGSFGAATGRNTPSASKFIFGPSVWLRGLIKPPPGRAIAYIDWSSQEVVIAAALSGDPALLDAVHSGDPYLAFAIRAGLAPADATKASHGRIRDMCKTAVLGVNYGMQALSLATRTGTSVIEAEHLLRALATAYPVYWDWAQRVIDTGILTGQLTTVFGWPVHVTANTRPTALRNYPMQANGAEMLRLACCLATERGIDVCAPIHDALLVEGALHDMEATVDATKAAMNEAAKAVLSGVEVRTDASIVSYPDRYSDPRGVVMWDRVTELVARR
jgi:DNA polymerase family A